MLVYLVLKNTLVLEVKKKDALDRRDMAWSGKCMEEQNSLVTVPAVLAGMAGRRARCLHLRNSGSLDVLTGKQYVLQRPTTTLEGKN